MCYHTKQTADATKLKNRLQAEFPLENEYETNEFVNGFDHTLNPVVTNENPEEIRLYSWGLVPSWATDMKIQNSTLNAKIETLREVPSFKNILTQRCLIPVTGFYEWKHLDKKGKHLEKYLITVEDSEIFCFAGLWNKCANPETGNMIETYSIITTEANELMATIHSKNRMPVILKPDLEMDWLKNGTVNLNNNLKAVSLNPPAPDLFSDI